MLDDLVQTIETLKKRIRNHRDDIQNYESRTRVTLIDPILRVLGWDVSDPAIVQIEPKGPGGWADYALLGNNGRTVVIFVEAKRLSIKDSPITQTVGYAVSENIENNANVRYCASTNGDTWEVYDITSQKSVMKASIATEDAAKCALKFLSLWRRSMADGVFDSVVEPVIDGSTPNSEKIDNGTSEPGQLVPGCKVLVKQTARAKSFRGKEGRLIMLGEGTGALIQVDNIKKWFSRRNLQVLSA